MITKPKWFYDEMKHVGVNYNSPIEVQVYDSKHQKFRDYQKGSEAITNSR